mgnify:FL=1
MIERGVKEVRDHFTQYLRKVTHGEEIIITERGKPVAMIKQVQKAMNLDEKLEFASLRGIIRLPEEEGPIQPHNKIKIKGKSLSEIIIEERHDKW